MATVKESVLQERTRLEAAFQALEQAARSILNAKPEAAKAEPAKILQVVPQASAQSADAMTRIEELVATHEQKLSEMKEEIGRLSVELVRIKDENRSLKDNNKKAAELLGESINVIEKLVA